MPRTLYLLRFHPLHLEHQQQDERLSFFQFHYLKFGPQYPLRLHQILQEFCLVHLQALKSLFSCSLIFEQPLQYRPYIISEFGQSLKAQCILF